MIRNPSTDDILIAGAGASGLSLAVHLVRRGLEGRRVLLLDPREEYDWDRTWCHWHVDRHPFEGTVRHRWHRWEVAVDGRRVVRGSRSHPYCHIPSNVFYEQALNEIERCDRVRLELGVAVHTLRETGSEVVAETTKGRVRARLAFDSRPARHESAVGEDVDVTLLQHFLGHRVRTPLPVFDPECATLMDFEVDQSRAIHFVYVLPFDAQTALVEDTYFGGGPFDDDLYEQGVGEYLRRRYGLEEWVVEGREKGVIPMTTAPPSSGRRIIPIGLRGGLAKPASGYAFLAIQRFSAEMARRLQRAEVPEPPPARPARTLFLDRVFLAHLDRHPERGPALFAALFSRVDTNTLIRFLSETGTIRDDLRVMRALPAIPLMREAVRSRRLWLRRRA